MNSPEKLKMKEVYVHHIFVKGELGDHEYEYEYIRRRHSCRSLLRNVAFAVKHWGTKAARGNYTQGTIKRARNTKGDAGEKEDVFLGINNTVYSYAH